MKYNSIFLTLVLGIALPTCSLGQFDSMVFFDTIESSQINAALSPLPVDLFRNVCTEIAVVSLQQPIPQLLGHRVLVYGRHFGALRALTYALKHPQSVVGLILESPILPINYGREVELLRLGLVAENTLRIVGIDGWSSSKGYYLSGFLDEDFWKSLLRLPAQLPIEIVTNNVLFPGCEPNCKNIFLTLRNHGYRNLGLGASIDLIEDEELSWLFEKVANYTGTHEIFTHNSVAPLQPITIPIQRTCSSSPISMRSISRTSSNATPPTPDFVKGHADSFRPRSWSHAEQTVSDMSPSSGRFSPYFAMIKRYCEDHQAEIAAEKERQASERQHEIQRRELEQQEAIEALQKEFAQDFSGKKKKCRRRALTDAELQQKSILYPNDAQ